MWQRWRTFVVGLAMAGGATGILLAGGDLAAQPVGQGNPPGFVGLPQGLPQVVMKPDETAPRFFQSPKGLLFRLWQREGDSRTGGGAVFLTLARPDDTWQPVLEISPEAGVTARDGDLAFGPSNELAVVYRWWRTVPRSKQVRLASSTDGGKTWSQPSTSIEGSGKGFEPKVAWTGRNGLVVLWSDERRANRLFDVYARRSADGGRTWEPEHLLSRFAKNGPNDVYNRPLLLGDGGDRLWAMWIGMRGMRSFAFLNRSVDGGQTWTDPVPVTGDSQSVFAPELLRVGERMLLVWEDTLGGQPDRLYAATSSDAGLTWTAPVRVDHLPAGFPAATSPTVLLNPDGEALVAWQDSRNGREDIFIARSADWGRTWGKEDQRMEMDEPGTAVSRYPKLAQAPDGRVALAWEDDRAGFESIYLRVRSAGQNPQWGPEIVVAPATGKLAARIPEVAWAPSGLHVAWQIWDHTLEPARIDKQVGGRTLHPDSRQSAKGQ
jgi:hypothetical protein